jgi:predicted nucleic acid-binding Zn ribbon protein
MRCIVSLHMSSTLLRAGLWIVILVLAAWVMHESLEETASAEFFAPAMLQKALVLGGLLVGAGIVLRMFEKTTKVVRQNRCAVCRKAIPSGAIYCRAHLRSVLHEEDDRTHMTRTRRS